MARVLCVAEKNDAAKNIALQLSGNRFQRAEGRSKYNKLYSFDGQFRGQPAKFVMTSVSGHLMTLDFGQGYKEWRPATTGELFSAPVIRSVNPNMLQIEQTLKEQSRGAEILVIWTDCDREGENIGAEIVSVCLSVNPRLDVYRARFSEITYQAVTRALNNVIRLDQNEVDAVDCRSELDLRIGAAFTRLQTLHLQSTVPTVLDGVVSYGSCQFPTLGFVVERYKAIKDFVPEPFWRLVGKHKRDGVDVEFVWDRNRLFDKQITETFHEVCNDADYATVTSVQKAPKSRWRPVALDTVEFEKLAVRKLRMSAKDAMAAAERLYTSGYVSYPRTETNIFPKEMDLASLVTAQGNSPDWGPFAQDIMTRGGPNPRNGVKTDEAHPPIHTLKPATKQELTRDWAVYELITRHFLACVSRNATGQSTTVKVDVSDEVFNANGIVIEDRGYLDVYKYDNWYGKMLPPYQEAERLKDFKVDINEGSTTAPLLLNEADLIALMDKHGIGTDATHAEHIEKIKERQYVALNPDKRFIPGFLGLALVDAYNEMGFEMSKPVLRSTLERGLVDICNGTRTKADVLAEQLQSYKRIFDRTEDRIILLSDIFKRYVGAQNLAGAAAGNHAPARGGRGAGRGGRGGSTAAVANRGGAAAQRGRGGGRGGGNAPAAPSFNFPTAGVQNPPPNNYQSSRPPQAPGPRPVVQAPRNALPPPGNGNPNPIVCGCGVPAPVRTANTSANRGRRFYGCAKQRDDPSRCNFFQWET
uniref:DNA topoisomerase n=1 Tax=Panagrellus redivivus TaxID=6233 RepID=A0A7E4VQF8_PANRE